ncbi:hypothetical protein [Arthrobacter sp. Soil762]|uniref:hypothetical protein n=1 Tax=Arthrobacter sp. Soil762 TaxID=1736401 RepID=UPI00070025B8|nr:hypothetical protein [Arthrobacter sp. Soil762]KRE72576.1 hypothetical protein ASG77_07860 [Arthrobacter sp. Soil762]
MSEELEKETADLEQKVNEARIRDQRQKWWLFGLAMLLAISVAIIVPLLNIALHQVDVSGAQVVTEQAEKKDLAKEAQQALCGTKDTEIFDKDLCEKLATAAQEPVQQPAEPPVVLGPSRADLVQAFRVYCAEGDNCRGADGADPTADDIAAAFVRFCSDGRCTGPAGEDGKPLAPQYEMVLAAVTDYCSAGACIGATGPGPSSEMVLAAVQTACANDACRGPAGPEGPGGPKGEPGRGIADTFCQDNGLWRITYTDGQVDDDGGRCRSDAGLVTPSPIPSLNL